MLQRAKTVTMASKPSNEFGKFESSKTFRHGRVSSKWHADNFGWVSGEIQNDCLLLKRLIQIRFNTGSKLCNREGLHVSMMEVPILERILMRSVIFRTLKNKLHSASLKFFDESYISELERWKHNFFCEEILYFWSSCLSSTSISSNRAKKIVRT